MSEGVVRVVPVILSGGSGTRLWPLSRELYPKQLLALSSGKTLLQETLCRLDGLCGNGIEVLPSIVVCNVDSRFLVLEQAKEVNHIPTSMHTFSNKATNENLILSITLLKLPAITEQG